MSICPLQSISTSALTISALWILQRGLDTRPDPRRKDDRHEHTRSPTFYRSAEPFVPCGFQAASLAETEPTSVARQRFKEHSTSLASNTYCFQLFSFCPLHFKCYQTPRLLWAQREKSPVIPYNHCRRPWGAGEQHICAERVPHVVISSRSWARSKHGVWEGCPRLPPALRARIAAGGGEGLS